MKHTVGTLRVILITLVIMPGMKVGAQELGSYAKDLIEDINKAKTALQAGKVTKSNWLTDASLEDPRYVIKGALSGGFRAKIYDRLYIMDNTPDKKACESAFSSLATSASQKGITYDETAFLMEANPVYGAVLADIKKVTGYMEDPKVGSLRLNPTEHSWLDRAVSKKFYNDWSSFLNGSTPEIKGIFDKEFDNLARAAAKSIPTTKPDEKNFVVRNKTEEDLMMGQMVPNLKVYKIGFPDANWEIQKDRLGIPEKRFRDGYMVVRSADYDHPYCKFCQVNIIQDYSGAGTYGQSYATFIYCWLVSAP